MLKALIARARRGNRPLRYPKGPPPALPEHFRGVPRVDPTRCPDGCRLCAEACPTDAITVAGGGVALDLGRCIFCPECVEACPEGAITFTDDYRLAARTPGDLRVSSGEGLTPAQALHAKLPRFFPTPLNLHAV